MKLYVGDLKPDLVLTCSDKDAAGVAVPVDLTTATSVTVAGTRSGAIAFSRPATNVTSNGTTSTVTLTWQAADTATPGRIFPVDVLVVWPGGKPQTFRATGADDSVTH